MRLVNKLNELRRSAALSMHVPGHKNMTVGNLGRLDWTDDMTEITGLDDLHSPEDILLELNEFLSAKYPGYHAQAVVNGTTTGILSAIYAVKDKVDGFLIIDDAHKSVYHGLDLTGASYQKTSAGDILKSPVKNKALIITYPTYSGDRVENLEGIIKEAGVAGAITIVDEAHGAHNDIAPGFLPSAMNYGADIVVQSYHKMLPALTGASVVFTNDRKLHRTMMKYIDYFETSSPSYLIMASIELAHQFYNDFVHTEFYDRRREMIDYLNAFGFMVKESDDPAKIILNREGISPYQLFEILDAADIYSEMVTDEGVLWCLPLFHPGHSYPLGLLFERLKKLSFNVPESIASKDEDLSFLIGKEAVRTVVPYPPGVPIIHVGEHFTHDIIKTIIHKRYYHVKMEGIEDNIECYKVEDDT